MIYTHYIYNDIYSAYLESYDFANKMVYRYCLYKFLSNNNFNWDSIYNNLTNNSFTIQCLNNTIYVYYEIKEVPTGKSPTCYKCLYFDIGNYKKVCTNTETIIEAHFINATSGDIIDNKWYANNGCALVYDDYIKIHYLNGSVWGYQYKNGYKTWPIYSESIYLKSHIGKIKVLFTLS